LLVAIAAYANTPLLSHIHEQVTSFSQIIAFLHSNSELFEIFTYLFTNFTYKLLPCWCTIICCEAKYHILLFTSNFLSFHYYPFAVNRHFHYIFGIPVAYVFAISRGHPGLTLRSTSTTRQRRFQPHTEEPLRLTLISRAD